MLKNQEITSKNQEASIRNIERQMGQLSKQVVIERPTSSLPSDTIPNPKEECKAIQLRSGKTLVSNKEYNKRPMDNDKASSKHGEASNKEEMTKSKQAQEKPKEKYDQPQDPRKGKQVMEEASQGQKQVDKFIFPADFVILDLRKEGNESIILGRPFLATVRAIIDVEQGELTLRVHDESITLNIFPEAQHNDEKEKCMEVDKEDLQWKEETNKTLINLPPRQVTSSKAGQEDNETALNDEKKQEGSEVLPQRRQIPKHSSLSREKNHQEKGRKSRKRVHEGGRIKRSQVKDFQRETKCC
ncbi:uncharacterized protein LOC107611105 [Arachis ipaensis]|uniref:uncharacterized protein LOC107611105 n=1 Tax=Arachis ipaensis TaxID=130454 RepID=UPI0007AF352B|nr:uncharacterized protein LOC107611105 [Arachis ipaensis]